MKAKQLEKYIVPLFIFVVFFFGINIVRESPPNTIENQLEVDFLDVGQGDSALVKTPNGSYFLIDGGPDKKILNELGKLMPPGKKDIEGIILSHPHADHVTGLNYVLGSYQVHKIYLTGVNHNASEYAEFLERMKAQNIPAEKMFFGHDFTFDGLSFSTLSPPYDLSGQNVSDLNDTSIVLNINYQSQNFLFLGDVSANKESEILQKPGFLKAQVMKISHHGSKTGTDLNMLGAVDPKYAVISVGKNNVFGHPAPSVLSLLSNRTVLRTDILGTIRFISDGKEIKNLN